jgi:ribose transport system substrate-binding protein
MKRGTLQLTFGLGCIAALLLAGCAAAATPAPAADTGGEVDTSDEEYIYVSMMGNLEFFNAHKYGWEWGGDALGVNATYVGPPDFDVNAQVAAFDQAIAKNPKGIVVFAVDSSPSRSRPGRRDRCDDLGDLPTSSGSPVGSHQYDLGYVGGTHLAEALGGKGKIAILSIPGTQMFGLNKASGLRYPGSRSKLATPRRTPPRRSAWPRIS